MELPRQSGENIWKEQFVALKPKARYEHFLGPANCIISKELDLDRDTTLPLFDWQSYNETARSDASPDYQWDRLVKLVTPSRNGNALLEQIESYHRNIASQPGTILAGPRQRELKALRFRVVHTVIDAMSRVSDVDYAIHIGTARIPENEHSLVEQEMSIFVRRNGSGTELCTGILSYEDFVAAKRQGYMDLCEKVAKDYIK